MNFILSRTEGKGKASTNGLQPELNRQPFPYKGNALPIKLCKLFSVRSAGIFYEIV